MAVRTTYYDNGASQGERLLKALLPEYVKVDERDLSQLLTFVAKYSNLINFYNIKNEIDGDWYPFLIRDISIFIATILSIDLDEIRQQNYQYINDIIRSNSRRGDKIASLRTFFKSILSIAHHFNTWHTHLSRINTTLLREVDGIELEIQNAIHFKLKEELQKLRSYDLGAAASETIGQAIGLSYEEFDKDWQIYDESVKARNIYDVEQLEFNARIDNALKKVQLVYRSFFNALTNIVKSSKKFLTDSLENDQTHQPHTSLLIAFLQIFKHNQNHLNTITERHLDLYYSKILNQKRKNWHPDQTIAKLIMADHVDKFVLKAGTRLQVSRDELGYNPIYQTDVDLHISRASIQSLKTLFVSKSLLVGMGSSYRLISNIYAAPYAKSQDGLGTPFEDPSNRWWAPFGEEQINKVAYERTMVNGDIGFVIASPILFLSEGQRSVQVIFRFEEESMGTFRKLIVDMSRNENMSMEDAFFKTFANAFDLYMSTEEGWYDVQKYEVLPPTGNWTGNDLTLNFILTANEPPIVANDPDVLEEIYRTKWPLLKVVLNTDDFVYAYSFLRDLLLDSITINVDVEEMRELEVYNIDGKVSLAASFLPFGGVPELNSSMIIGHEELIKKEITDLQLKIEWHKLPYNFDAAYAAYELDITNESFKVQLSALKNGKYIPEKAEERQAIRLFKEYTSGNTDQVNPTRIIDEINLKKLRLEPKYTFRMPEEYNHTTKNGFLKFELTDPEEAFGHIIYPEKLTEVVNENIPEVTTGWFSSKVKPKKKLKPLPKDPYTPIINSLSLSYSATTEIVVSPTIYAHNRFETPENIFHVEPFGIVNTYSNGRTHNRHIVPQYDEDGYLFIGLENLKPPQFLTLLFPMSESARGSRFYDMLDIEWCYLSSNEWIKFTPEQIVMDTTDRFTTIGIVTLEIPRNINKRNTILPNDLHWIRVSIRGDVDILGKALDIETQAVTATWVPDPETDPEKHLANPLMPHEPIELETIIAEVAETQQPLGSLHGKTSEKNTEYYARISERLRHKSRAVTHWDYEHLVLNQFSDIYQIKCLSHLTNSDFVKHGNLLMVAVPKMQHNSINKLPTVNTSLLQEIKEYLQEHTSPFVSIEVRNPEYEKIKISCNVAFTEGNSNGQTLKQLNQDIKKFVCPWLFGIEAELELGGSITKDNLLDFIEKRPYVAFVTKFSVVQVTKITELYTTEDTAVSKDIAPVIYASKPWAVIVPIDKHQISVIENYNYQAPEMSAMDTMMLDVDFVIRSEAEEEKEEEQEEEVFYPEKMSIREIIADDADDRYVLDIDIDFED